MQAIDARLLRGAAVPTAVAGAIAVVLCAVLVGSKGLIGALLGSVIVLAFFSVTIVVISRVAQSQPQMLLGYAMLTYLGKIFFLAALMIAFKHTTLFHFRSFGFTMLGLTVGVAGRRDPRGAEDEDLLRGPLRDPGLAEAGGAQRARRAPPSPNRRPLGGR